MVKEPAWPFAYQKWEGSLWERKGRTNQDLQDMRHECNIRGCSSKCHRCEKIACGSKNRYECDYQIQGAPSSEMSKNIPTSDSPWSPSTGRIATTLATPTPVMCVRHHVGLQLHGPISARHVEVCHAVLGLGGGRATPGTHLEDQPGSGINTDMIRLVDGEEWVATDKWEYARRSEAQGQVTTLAGHSSEEGYADGCGSCQVQRPVWRGGRRG